MFNVVISLVKGELCFIAEYMIIQFINTHKNFIPITDKTKPLKLLLLH